LKETSEKGGKPDHGTSHGKCVGEELPVSWKKENSNFGDTARAKQAGEGKGRRNVPLSLRNTYTIAD